MKAEESDKERKRKTGHQGQKARKEGWKHRGGNGNLFHYKTDRDAHRLDTEGPKTTNRFSVFSQQSEESVFRFK